MKTINNILNIVINAVFITLIIPPLAIYMLIRDWIKPYKPLGLSTEELYYGKYPNWLTLSDEEKQKLIKKSKEDLKNINEKNNIVY
jgi:hypothetical protein